MPGSITLVDVLRQSIDELHGRMDAIEAAAVADQRDTLNDVEQATWDELRAEAEAKTARLELLVSRGELDAQAGELVARIRGGATRDDGEPAPLGGAPAFPYTSPGDYVLGYMRSRHGDTAESARFTRALADVVTAGTPGLVPPQVTGDVLGLWLANRPAVDAMTKPPLPPVGMEVQRPRITQHTDVQKHTEKADVASRALALDLLKIPLESWAGGVDVSWELANRSSPAALDVIFRDLVSIYARNSDAGAWATFFAMLTNPAVVWDGEAGTLTQALADAAVMVASNSAEKVWPDTAWLGLNAFGALAGLTDATGRPMFPYLGPANAPGTSALTGQVSTIAGLRPVIDPNIPPSAFVVGNSEEVEFYETPSAPVQLSVVDVGVAGYDVGVIGMFGVAAVDPKAFAKITGPTLPLEAAASGSESKAAK